LSQAEPALKQPNLKGLGDASGIECRGCPTWPKPIFETRAVYNERDWQQFHSPKNIVMDLTSEVGELAEHFRWLTEEQSRRLDEEQLAEVSDEIADVFKAILYLAHQLGVDPIRASFKKLEKMEQKYPAEKSRGKALKYTAYINDNPP